MQLPWLFLRHSVLEIVAAWVVVAIAVQLAVAAAVPVAVVVVAVVVVGVVPLMLAFEMFGYLDYSWWDH